MNNSPDVWLQGFARPFGNPEKKVIAAALIQQPALIGDLLNALSNSPTSSAARMAWVIEEISSVRPDVLIEHTETIMALIISSNQQAVLRNLLKVMQYYRISDLCLTILFDRCLRLASGQDMEVAVRCNALSLAYHIAMQYPGLEQELFVLAQSLQHEGSAGMQTRIRKLLLKTSKP